MMLNLQVLIIIVIKSVVVFLLLSIIVAEGIFYPIIIFFQSLQRFAGGSQSVGATDCNIEQLV